MMKRSFLLPALLFSFAFQIHAQRPAPDKIETDNGALTIQPIQHATFAMNWNGITIYVDPTGGTQAFNGLDQPDLILITDIHGDHMNIETLNALSTENTTMITPKAVAEKLPESIGKETVVLDNGESTQQANVSIKAIPMYNLPESSDSYHTRGRGNGYLLTIGGKNIYISGDTEDIPEMRSLKNIDVAFVCMNLPYTMDVKQAASAVLEFKPSIVYPYHYRGQDTEEFKKLVNDKNEDIEVRLRDWYAGS